MQTEKKEQIAQDVLVSIRGMQMLPDASGDEVEVVTSGSYLRRDGKHFIRYEEVVEGMDGTIQNLVKLDEQGMEVTKRGLTNTHMIFQKDKKNITYYQTPFGNLQVGIAATSIDVKDNEKKIDVTVNYALDINYEHLADCTISMRVEPREAGAFHLS